MSCNYKLQYRTETGWVEQLHIGKQSSGWKFLFRAHTSPWNDFKITSFSGLKEILDEVEDWQIFDEYRKPVDADALFERIERNQSDEFSDTVEHVHSEDESYIDKSKYWHDDEGYCFCDNEFS